MWLLICFWSFFENTFSMLFLVVVFLFWLLFNWFKKSLSFPPLSYCGEISVTKFTILPIWKCTVLWRWWGHARYACAVACRCCPPPAPPQLKLCPLAASSLFLPPPYPTFCLCEFDYRSGYVSGIIQYLSVCDCLISFSRRTLYYHICQHLLFSCKAWILLCMDETFFFIHS